ncbi:MAG: hypothetical protein PHW95_05100 [Patescibacteria group bacterium]|nr:hypothetical protein [Patescibacteria group bacterium]
MFTTIQSWAKIYATTQPRPDDAPVMMATLFSSSIAKPDDYLASW